jgi:hypothetical protein
MKSDVFVQEINELSYNSLHLWKSIATKNQNLAFMADVSSDIAAAN